MVGGVYHTHGPPTGTQDAHSQTLLDKRDKTAINTENNKHGRVGVNEGESWSFSRSVPG